jgi:hypothetical protein
MFMLRTYMHPWRCASTTHFWGVECAIPSGLFGLRIKNSAVHYPRGSLHKKDYATEQPTCSVLRSEKSTVLTTHLTFQEASQQHKRATQRVTQGHQESLFSVPGPISNTLHTDCTKGWHKGLLKDTENHSSVYHGPSLIHCMWIVAT